MDKEIELRELLDIAKKKLYPYQNDKERLEIMVEKIEAMEGELNNNRYLAIILEFVERYNKQDSEPKVAEAARILQKLL